MRSRLTFGPDYTEEHPLWKIPPAIFHASLLHVVLSGLIGLNYVNPFSVLGH